MQIQQHPLHTNNAWGHQFDCSDVTPLIICRGPIRKEAMEVFNDMGITDFGILISEKDSIIYPNALSPELRQLKDRSRAHFISDYTGINKEERLQRIQQIIAIAKNNQYDSIFAGYGFMAEDGVMIRAMEQAGLRFIGPGSQTAYKAGFKDEAKHKALELGVSVTPGINTATSTTLLRLYPDLNSLQKLSKKQALNIDSKSFEQPLQQVAEELLQESYQKGIDLFDIDDLAISIQQQVGELFSDYPDSRLRLKAIGGGGGKGQRILPAANSVSGDNLSEKIETASRAVPALVHEILAEVKCNGVGDNKNMLIELNIETSRHQEIQVMGNGDWCISLGGRDCSLQMHEQKLVEISVTVEELQQSIDTAKKLGLEKEAQRLITELATLTKMEEEAVLFSQAVGLDSVSTFECIVAGDNHFFMEMNTRIQVEHRVTELCYGLRFSNPDNPDEWLEVNSLIALMVLLSRHGAQLSKPQRIPRELSAIEVRLNATNQALQPHAGGTIEYWSQALNHEIRDDQGICDQNPDTDVFMSYYLSGAYDSNIALLLTSGSSRSHNFQRMAEILRHTSIRGNNLSTNLEFHYGLVNWFIGQNCNARPTTGFITPYLTLVGCLSKQAQWVDINSAYEQLSTQLYHHKAGWQDWQKILDRKQNLLLRPLQRLLSSPHLLAGWLSLHSEVVDGQFRWLKNPIHLLQDMYVYLNLDYRKNRPAINMIWKEDQHILNEATRFYRHLSDCLSIENFPELNKAIKGLSDHSDTISNEVDNVAIIAAHQGFQAGMDILKLLPFIAQQAKFFDLYVADDLSIIIPEELNNIELQEQMSRILAPPPDAQIDTIVAPSGGMFYFGETPDTPPLISEGQQFSKGQPLCIIEVMKMFNKLKAPCSGTIDKIFIEQNGAIISKGQPLFKIIHDNKSEPTKAENPDLCRQQQTLKFIQSIDIATN